MISGWLVDCAFKLACSPRAFRISPEFSKLLSLLRKNSVLSLRIEEVSARYCGAAEGMPYPL
jgi:hypothetical protein